MFITDDECASKLTEGDQQTITALYIHDANLLLKDTVNTPLVSTYMYTTNYVLYVNIHTFYTLLVKISTLCTLCHLAIHCVKELRLSCASTVLETLLVSLHSSGAATGIVGGGEGITVSAFYGKPACLRHKLQPAIKWP